MKVRILFAITFFLIPFFLFAGDCKKKTREEYIAQYKNDAVKDMKKTGVPASITLAQALLESEDGNSTLATEANNHFGIKCAEWTGPTYNKDDDRRDECFRKYNSALESYDDHSTFLKTRDRYAFLFSLELTDYKGWAKGLKKAGYATNPQYAERLIKIIEDYQLNLLDAGKNIPLDVTIAGNSKPQAPVINAPSNPVAEVEKIKTGKKYSIPSNEVDIFAKRKVLNNNGVDYIIARKGDNFNSLSKELELGYWQLPKYNEMESDTPIKEGQIIYIKPKNSETTKAFYVVKDGETVHSISQDLGIKSKYIYKWNNLSDNQEVKPGQKIWLQKHKG